jgi:hypothetical protein
LGKEEYQRVNELLGIDMQTGEGAWPAGLHTHVGGASDGGWIVFELWASRADQERFLEERLGPALAEAGIEGPPARMEWIEISTHQTPGT